MTIVLAALVNLVPILKGIDSVSIRRTRTNPATVASKLSWIYNNLGISFMQVSKWGNSLAVRLPAVVVEALDLKEGDEIEISISGNATSRCPVTGPNRGRSISFVK